MEQFDEKKLKLFIEEKFKVSSYRSPFYIKWIRMYNNYIEKLDYSENNQDKFIRSLSSNYPDWQVVQADKAVTIFLSFTRKNDKYGSKSSIRDNTNWKNIIFNMKEEIRL